METFGCALKTKNKNKEKLKKTLKLWKQLNLMFRSKKWNEIHKKCLSELNSKILKKKWKKRIN